MRRITFVLSDEDAALLREKAFAAGSSSVSDYIRHWIGSGCPIPYETFLSSQSVKKHIEISKQSRVYFVQSGDLVKIGYTTNLQFRLYTFRIASPLPILLLVDIPGGRPEEKRIHKHFEHLRHHGEWFRLTPELQEFIDNFVDVSAAIDRRMGNE